MITVRDSDKGTWSDVIKPISQAIEGKTADAFGIVDNDIVIRFVDGSMVRAHTDWIYKVEYGYIEFEFDGDTQ